MKAYVEIYISEAQEQDWDGALLLATKLNIYVPSKSHYVVHLG